MSTQDGAITTNTEEQALQPPPVCFPISQHSPATMRLQMQNMDGFAITETTVYFASASLTVSIQGKP